MERYDYQNAVENDVRNYVSENVNLNDFETKEELCNWLNDNLWMEDSVTGNASGSYTFNAWEAEENLCHNWDLLSEATEEMGLSTDMLKDGPESCDVAIRCFLLGQAVDAVVDEVWEEKEEEE